MYKTAAVFLFVCASFSSLAQEHWLVPQRYFYSVRELAYIRLKTGQQKESLTATIRVNPGRTFLHYRPNGTISSIGKLPAGLNRDSIILPIQEAGTHMVVLQQSQGPVSVPVDSLEKLLTNAGFRNKTGNRQNDYLPTKEGSILFQENLKTLFQVSGDLTDACIQPSKLVLDIIPEENPYAVPDPGRKAGPVTVRFRVLFKGKPLSHTLVNVSFQVPGKGWQTNRFQTNKRGWIEAERHPGEYRISCTHAEPAENDPAAHLQYYWASLNFDYSQYFR